MLWTPQLDFSNKDAILLYPPSVANRTGHNLATVKNKPPRLAAVSILQD
jgi:hypothetical protein